MMSKQQVPAAGELRASQVVTSYGPGSMIDLPDDSVIVAGLEEWKYDRSRISDHIIDERRLLEKLKVALGVDRLEMRKPPRSREREDEFQARIGTWRFPEWFLVQKVVQGPKFDKARRLVRSNELDRSKFILDGKREDVVPIRFVKACAAGHIDDIDWRVFVHGREGGCYQPLYIEERGVTGDLDEVYVVCSCRKDRQLSLAAKRGSMVLGMCNGERPWLGRNYREHCGRESRLLVRSASNAYFPQLLSVISIPDGGDAVDRAVAPLWDDFLHVIETIDELGKDRSRRPRVRQQLEGFSDAQVMAAIERRRGGGGSDPRPIKQVEFEALADAKAEIGRDEPGGDFFARELPIDQWQADWMRGICRVALVHRLREVVAQVGFTRFEAASNDQHGELDLKVKAAKLSAETEWVPAIENRGEGLFIQFESAAIDRWATRKAVRERGRQLLAGFDIWKKDHELSSREFFGVPYVMLHSLSHLLMTAMSLECGYPASSLRERVYAFPEQFGILIFTGSSDAEGTLGGLVEAGRRVREHMRRALELGTLCSNDPICAFHQPQQHDHQPLLGSACHGCLLIAETSCEQHNDFLDRSLVVPTVDRRGAEFFTWPA